MNQKTHDELQAKLKHLKTVRRHELSKAIGEAREHGDLKENSAYHEAKNEQGLNEAKIRELEETLRYAEIVNEDNLHKDEVRMGLSVQLQDQKSKEKFEYKLVSETEADIFENKISISSPLGSALVGAKVGEIVEFDAPLGLMKYKVLKIF